MNNSQESTEIWKAHNLTLKNPNSFQQPHGNMAFAESPMNKPSKSSMWTWISLLFLLIILANSFFTTILLTHFTYSNQETTSLLRSIDMKLNAQQQNYAVWANWMDLFSHEPMTNRKEGANEFKEEFERLVAPSPTPRSECRCPTCTPTVEIPTNQDPVSLVNQAYAIKAKYSVITVCIAPPIHIATLSIEGEGKTWKGTGDTKKRAKHEAAYKALKDLRPDMAEVAVGAGYIEEEENHLRRRSSNKYF